MSKKWFVACGVISIICFRIFACEAYIVDTPSMAPTMLPTEIYCVDKLSCGALMPRRFADIPIVNVFTWIAPLRKMDEGVDWGFHRIPGFNQYQNGDVILFYALDGSKNILVKRIVCVAMKNGSRSFYVLGDNRDNSADSRCFGWVPDSMVIGRARYVLLSWNCQEKALKKFRWERVGFDISSSSIPN